ncbi:MAG: glutamine--tRNA ligase/YqeY domain fusion protein [Bacteroidota bacterium]|nr:glutamine--tRNA ligase/YqeY domain fusion protein [Bacteroidota bacterium]
MSENDSLGKNENFLEQIIKDDLGNSHSQNQLRFRFPPEPNGYLHIGHAKSIYINFGFGQQFSSPVNLRFDDTNPEKESVEYINSIKNDIRWLGYSWDKECYASDYFDQLYDWAEGLIKKGKAYVDDQNQETISDQRGIPTIPGKESPFRDRDVDTNLDLFRKMKDNYFKPGDCVLRAKIDMSSPNMHMRDPIMYRIIDHEHHRTKDNWVIYPTYDWAHGQSDYIENISHSFCTLEFEVHRELYDWFISNISDEKQIIPKQREFARLNISYTIMSKRKLLELVESNEVDGWDDPRMPTISGMRRRGIPPAAIISFCEKVGVAKRENIIDFALLDYCTREVLNKKAYRLMVVIDPVELEILNYPDEKNELLKAENNPEDESYGHREISFSKNLYIERDDFKEEFNRKYFRLSIGKEVRLKNAYIIKGERVEKNDSGEIIKIYCTYDPKSKSGSGTEESLRKVKGTIHWIDKNNYEKISVNNYDRLFKVEAPDGNKDDDFKTYLNENSFVQVKNAYAESNIRDSKKENYYQFQRNGYYKLESKNKELTFNRTVTLRDTWKSKS